VIAEQQGEVLADNVRWLLGQGVHRDRIVAQTGRASLDALIRALERLNENELAKALRADPAPEAVNARAAAPITKRAVRRRG
jgi:hypothetical protein